MLLVEDFSFICEGLVYLIPPPRRNYSDKKLMTYQLTVLVLQLSKVY